VDLIPCGCQEVFSTYGKPKNALPLLLGTNWAFHVPILSEAREHILPASPQPTARIHYRRFLAEERAARKADGLQIWLLRRFHREFKGPLSDDMYMIVFHTRLLLRKKAKISM
jgi:hypothetical protein